MRGGALLGLGLLVVVLGGCMQPWNPMPSPQEGMLRIEIHAGVTSASTVGPTAISTQATHVRIRVWHPTTGFNAVRTVALGTTPSSVNIPVPQGTGYRVDALSYYVRRGRALALTGGRAPHVTVTVDETTRVEIELRPWSTQTASPDVVKPATPYTVEFVISDAGGLLTRETFRTATLHAATTTFQNANAALPLYPETAGVVFDDRLVFSTVAPAVTVKVTLYVAALVEFVPNWNDLTRTDADEFTLFLEVPNRHMGATLHSLVVDPSTGGIVIGISSTEQ